jgi:hypothetical protein
MYVWRAAIASERTSSAEVRASATGRLHSMASGSFRDAKLERPVSGAELRRLLVASRPNAAAELLGKLSLNVRGNRHTAA